MVCLSQCLIKPPLFAQLVVEAIKQGLMAPASWCGGGGRGRVGALHPEKQSAAVRAAESRPSVGSSSCRVANNPLE